MKILQFLHTHFQLLKITGAWLFLIFNATPHLLAKTEQYAIRGREVLIPLEGMKSSPSIMLFLADGNLKVSGSDVDQISLKFKDTDKDDIGFVSVDPETGNVQFQLQGSQIETDLRIEVPASSTIQLKVSDGDVSISEIRGDIDVAVSDGNIYLQDIGGSISANACDGDITLKTNSILMCKNLTLSTLDGDINLELPKNIDFSLKARTADGEIICDYAYKPSPFQNAKEDVIYHDKLEFHTADKGFPILLSTLDGDIRISKSGNP